MGEPHGVPESQGEGVWVAPLPAAAAARRPRPREATLGEVAAGLSHGVEEGPSRVASGATDESLFSVPEASRRSRSPSRARRGSPPAETEHCCSRCSQ